MKTNYSTCCLCFRLVSASIIVKEIHSPKIIFAKVLNINDIKLWLVVEWDKKFLQNIEGELLSNVLESSSEKQNPTSLLMHKQYHAEFLMSMMENMELLWIEDPPSLSPSPSPPFSYAGYPTLYSSSKIYPSLFLLSICPAAF